MIVTTATNIKEIGAFFAKRRKELGLYQSDVSKGTGVATSNISHFENGIRMPEHNNLMLLFDFVGIVVEVK